MNPPNGEFERIAHSTAEQGLVRELWAFLCNNKKWWLLPILVAILMLGALVMLSGSAAAPFVYTLF